MGFFSKLLKEPQPYERDWSVGPIVPHRIAPDSEDANNVTQRVIRASGTNDPLGVALMLIRLLSGAPKHYLANKPDFDMDALDPMFDTIMERKDFKPNMLIDCWSYYGPTGIAVARKLCEELPSFEDTMLELASKNKQEPQASTAVGEKKHQEELSDLAVKLADQGDFEGAMKALKEEEQICRELGDQEALSISLITQADTLYEMGKHGESLATAKQAYDNAKNAGLDGLAEVIGIRIEVFQGQG